MPETPTVLFVCHHGSAKSVIAARYLERLAHARGLSLECSAAGLEADAAVPAHVVTGLRDDGFDEVSMAPRQLTEQVLQEADTIVAFGCDLSAFGSSRGRLVTWDGVPAVSDGFDAARDDIARRVQDLLDELERAVKTGRE